MRTLAIVNQKGGCGKTTTAINLSAILAQRGKRTLLVDMDPQSHCAAGLGVPERQIEFSIGEALIADDVAHPLDGLFWEVSRHFELAPSTTRLATLEAPGGGLHERADRDRRLAAVLDRVRDRFDYCLIDCPPTIGLLTFNALRAANEAIIPIETGYFSLRGAEKQWQTIQRIIDRLNRPIICHMVPTLYDPDSRIGRQLLQQLQRRYEGQLVDTPIREHESLREAASYGQPIVEYAPGSEACRDFEALADWLEEHDPGRSRSTTSQIEVRPSPLIAARPTHRPFSTSDSNSPGGSVSTASRIVSSRAAELARRVRELQATTDAETVEPRDEQSNTVLPAVDPTTRVHRQMRHRVRFGTNQTVGGVVLCQPYAVGRDIFVSGEFNHWATHQDRLHFSERTKSWQATLMLTPGRYLYRLVIDGVPQPDQYNDERAVGPDGEPCSVLIVE